MSKGIVQRPLDKEKFAENWERIFNKKNDKKDDEKCQN